MSESDPARDVLTPDGRKIHGARKVLPGDTQEDFLRWAFHNAGENPLAWQASARDLLDGANAVKARVLPDANGLVHSLASVQALLLGYALECLLKGMYIKRHRVWEDRDKKHAIARNGAYARVRGARDHDLSALANAAGLELTEQERFILDRLKDFILFAGRYPIPTKVEDMEPVRTPDGKTVARRYITRADLETAEALANRLMIEVEPWR
jgi:hypothetical protein